MVLLEFSVPSHIWNLPGVGHVKVGVILVSLLVSGMPEFCVLVTLKVCIGHSFLVRLQLCWGCLWLSDLRSVGALCDGQIWVLLKVSGLVL